MSKSSPQKPSPKFAGKCCELCGKEYTPHEKTGKYPRMITHHLRYPDPAHPDLPEVTAVLCLACHNWLSGNGKVYGHPLKPRDMTPRQRAEGPYAFAAAVADLYERKVIIPEVIKELEKNYRRIDDMAFIVPPKRESSH